jgi:hypothetical protein
MKAIFALAAAVAMAPSPPFPAPKLMGTTPDMKCDWGPVTEYRADKALLVIQTAAGPFELGIGSGVKFASVDGKPLGSVAAIKPGQRVRAYYVVDVKRGAGALEVDVIPDAPPAQ